MESVEAPSRVPAAEGAASRRTPGLSFRVWPGPTPGFHPGGRGSNAGPQSATRDPPRGRPAGVRPGERREAAPPLPARSSTPAARRSPAPYCRGVGPATPALPAFAPRTPQLRIGRSRSLPASSLPPLDWLHPGAEAPPISPGPLITRLPALPGPGSQPRAFLSGLLRREVRHARVGWAAERRRGSTSRGAAIPGCPGSTCSPPNSLPRPEAPSVVGTIPPTRRCWSASWERPDIRPTSAGPFDRGTACMRPCKLGAPTDTGTGSSYLVPQWRPKRSGVGDFGVCVQEPLGSLLASVDGS